MHHSKNITMSYLRDNQSPFHNYSNVFLQSISIIGTPKNAIYQRETGPKAIQ